MCPDTSERGTNPVSIYSYVVHPMNTPTAVITTCPFIEQSTILVPAPKTQAEKEAKAKHGWYNQFQKPKSKRWL